MQQEVSAGSFTIRGLMRLIESGNLLHNLYAQRVRFGTVPEPAFAAVFFQQGIHAFRQTNKAEHRGKVFTLDQPFPNQEIAFKEAAFLHQEPDAGIHVPGHYVHYIGQLILFEILDTGGALGNAMQQQAAKRIRAARLVQAIVAAGNAVIIPQFAPEHSVIGKAGFGRAQRALHTGKQEFIRRILADPHGQVRHSILQFCFHLHDQAAGTGIRRANVRMAEGIQNGAVNLDKEQTQRFLGGFIIHLAHIRLQQGVQIANIHRIIGNAGYIVVQNQQVVKRLPQVLRRVQLQKLTALFQELGIVRTDIAGPVRCIPFKQITDTAFRLRAAHQRIELFRLINHGQKILGMACQIGDLLFVRSGFVLDCSQNFTALLFNGFHGNGSHLQVSSRINTKQSYDFSIVLKNRKNFNLNCELRCQFQHISRYLFAK